MPWRGKLVAAVVLGASLAAGARASLASLRETAPPEGWSFARADYPAARAVSAGPLRPSVHELGLSALQGITRGFDTPMSQVAVDADLPEGGVLEIRLGLSSLKALRPTLIVVAGSERARGGRVTASSDPTGASLTCSPEQLGPVAPGRHRLELHTGHREWLVMIDGVPVSSCTAAPLTWRELTITPGQFRVHLHTAEVSGAGPPQSQAFAKGTFLADIAASAVAVGAAGAAVFFLVARGHRLVVASAALSPLLLAFPLSLADMRQAAARFRLLPDVAVALPWLLPCFLALLAVAHLPSPGPRPHWATRGRAWLAGGGALAAAAACARGGLDSTAPLLAVAAAVLLALRHASPAEAVERALALGAPLFAVAAVADAQWAGHLVGAGAILAVAGLTPVVGGDGRRASPWLLALMASTLVAALELAARGGPQAQAWTAGTAPAAEALDPAGTSGQSHRAALLDAAASLARNCQLRAVRPRAGALRVAVFGGSSTTPANFADLPTYYPAVIERVWNWRSSRAPIQVVNQGAPGWTTNDISECVEQIAPALEADLALFYVGRNDTIGFGGVRSRASTDQKPPSALAKWLESSSLLRAVQFTLLGVVIDGGVSPAPPAVARANLAHAADRIRAAGGYTLLLSEATFPGSQTYAEYRRMLAELADSRDDVAYLDVASALDERLDPSLFKDEVHLTTAGHEYLGNFLAAQMFAHPEWFPPTSPARGSGPSGGNQSSPTRRVPGNRP